MSLLLILLISLVAGIVSGIIGTGSSIMLVPVLAWLYGPKQAVPIMAVAAVLANVSRVLAWCLGARALLALPPRAVDAAIGLFLLVMIPARRWLARHLVQLRRPHLAAGGAVIGFLTGIVASTGPADVPLFLGYGLTKGAFIGTEAADSFALSATKTLTFQNAGALPADQTLKGLSVGASLMAGSFLAKPLLLRLAPEIFRFVMDALLLVSGTSLLWSAAR